MKKIYYIPGLISAMLIPVLFWYYGNQKFEEINVSVMDIGLPAKEREEDKNTYSSFEPYRNWNYKKIEIAPGTAKDHSKLYVSELKNLQEKNGKNTGVEFILDKNNTYGDFVSILNDMEIAKQYQYAIDLEKTGHIFAIHDFRDATVMIDTSLMERCGTDHYFPEEYYFKGFQKFEYQLSQLPQQSFFIIFGFLVLLNISMFSIKEKFQIHSAHHL
ncbi:hypothetical protein EGI16_10460 [Chryseobacterium sp. G0240]|uniref:hypothetical protein n=1 Tax=Chryseobacterium sp. G0240 TaxID=2487066 RepID=UPI000F4477C2|nr:hypothetical protein [Chryseobacterium sp. G0240]ROI03862.1 hypothetical protein EGI16_10460 [Chryseobacterium sp. G0240]